MNNDTVFTTLIRAHDVVAFCIFLDTLQRLPGVLRQNFVQARAHAQDFPCMDIDVRRLAPETGHERLVDDDPRVGE